MIGILILLFIILMFVGIGLFAYSKYRSVLRYAKGIERGLKMVPMLIRLPPSSDDTEVGSRDVRDVMQEKVSQAEVLYNVLASTAKQGFKSDFYGQRHISIEMVNSKGLVYYYMVAPVTLVEVVKQAVLSAYPTAQLEEVDDHNIFSEVGKISGTIGGELELKKDFAYPIATIQETRRDAMQSLLNAMSGLTEEDGVGVQIMLRPAHDGWDKTAKAVAEKIRKNKGKKGGGMSISPSLIGDLVMLPWKPMEPGETKPEDKQLSSVEQQIVDSIDQKTKYSGYEVLIRVIASSNTSTRAQSVLRNIVSAFSLFDSPSMNGFKYNEAKDIEALVTSYILRFFPPETNKNVLNSVELATVFHFPDDQFTPSKQVQRQSAKQVDGPTGIPQKGLLLGHNIFRGVKKEIRLGEQDRRRHIYAVGQTGTGKSGLLENLILQDMMNGDGFAFIDPHGDTAEKLMTMVPKERVEDVIYFNPGDMNNPIGLNLFENDGSADQKDFLVQEAINMLYKLYDPQHQGIIGPRYEHWFRNAALTIMADPKGATFIEIPKVFEDNNYVKEKLKYVKDPTVLSFWNDEMAKTSDYHKSEVLGWFVSKFGAFRSNEMMRNIIGQVKSGFDIRDVMDNKKILLVNLSKGKVGELNSKLLGMIFVMKFQAAAMGRANMQEEDRKDFCLYVDEFQNFSTDSFATILSEARKYRLNLIVANQFISQLSEEIRDAVFGNVGTIVTLRSSAADADFLIKQYSPTFETSDIVKLPNFTAIMKLMINGVPSQPFSMSTIPPLGTPNEELGKTLIQLSAAKHGRPRALVEEDIFKRMETKKPNPPANPNAKNVTSGAGPAPVKKPGSSSFLDEWLAKKKQSSEDGIKKTPPVSAVQKQPPENSNPVTNLAQPGIPSVTNQNYAPSTPKNPTSPQQQVPQNPLAAPQQTIQQTSSNSTPSNPSGTNVNVATQVNSTTYQSSLSTIKNEATAQPPSILTASQSTEKVSISDLSIGEEPQGIMHIDR